MVPDLAAAGRGMMWDKCVKRQMTEGPSRPMDDGFARPDNPHN
jgi:hypothetical protein